jgi:hypothetical protein
MRKNGNELHVHFESIPYAHVSNGQVLTRCKNSKKSMKTTATEAQQRP